LSPLYYGEDSCETCALNELCGGVYATIDALEEYAAVVTPDTLVGAEEGNEQGADSTVPTA